MTDETTSELSVAIIGLACRLPGANSAGEFWHNLANGVDSISHFTEEEMRSFGVKPEVLQSPDFVRVAPVVNRADCFDANFFGVAPREAALTDPQHRVFLECAWEALESSGYKPDRSPQPLGVFAGTSLSSYLLYNILPNLDGSHSDDNFQAMIGNDKDFLSTRVSYKLNLHGPSVDLQTGCSTSLVAVHMACQSLLSYQCDMALAGGVSIQTPERRGYVFQQGGIASPDGRCRAFDANAAGTVFGSGAGVVVLKRLADSISDRDHIIAVVKGSAINNDGSAKLGFTAPSVSGQSEVIRSAQLLAGVDARSISYVECHGTATPLGDPAEVAALTEAFRTMTSDTQFCAIGSVKTNIGHLDAAAGIAGLIKTALALEHEELPPSLYYEQANPQIVFLSTPFFVNAVSRKWPRTQVPRRAGVSSFGIGGTNAHVILEQAPECRDQPSQRTRHLICVSARNLSALDTMTRALADHLENNSSLNIADVAYTLATGRNTYPIRRAEVCTDIPDAIRAFRQAGRAAAAIAASETKRPQIIFMFPGGGSQYVRMGANLYATEPTFRHELDLCAELSLPWLGCDLRSHLFPAEESTQGAARMRGTTIGLPALFAVEYSLAKLWMSWGIRPSAMIGHSLGEYVAACLSGVLSLEDALGVVATRAALMNGLPQGAMVSVSLPLDELRPLLSDKLSIAAINGPAQVVVSGTIDATEELLAVLAEQQIESRRLQIAVASHSSLVEPMLHEFESFVKTRKLSVPTIPYISNLTGDWISGAQATDPNYWVQHLRQSVLFHAGMETLLKDSSRVFLEVGPGNTLSTLTQLLTASNRDTVVFPSMRHRYDPESDETFIHRTAARLWEARAVDDWSALYDGELRTRVPLPTYPFEKQRHWISPPASFSTTTGFSARHASLGFYASGWESAAPIFTSHPSPEPERKWFVFATDHPLCKGLIQHLQQSGCQIAEIYQGSTFRNESEHRITIRATVQEDYDNLLMSACAETGMPILSVHMWNLTSESSSLPDAGALQQTIERGSISVSRFVRSITDKGLNNGSDIVVVCNRAFPLEVADGTVIEKSLLLGLCRVISQEHPGTRCRLIDIGEPNSEQLATLPRKLLAEFHHSDPLPVVALRGSRRWARSYAQVDLSGAPAHGLRENGVYLLFGGTGEIGLALLESLFARKRAKLVVVSRHAPALDSTGDPTLAFTAAKPLKNPPLMIEELKQNGAIIEVLRGDISNEDEVQDIVRLVLERFGELHGIFHLAGETGEDVVHLLTDSVPDAVRRIAEAKVSGVRSLERVALSHALDFIVLFSSTAALLGGVGLSSYAASNAVLDTAAEANQILFPRTRWISIAWDAWLTPRYAADSILADGLRENALRVSDGVDALISILDSGIDGSIVVSKHDLHARMEESLHSPLPGQSRMSTMPSNALEPVSSEMRPYAGPVNELEEIITAAWQDHLGVARIGRDDRFFELGGNSLLALRIASRLKKDLGYEVSLLSIFEGVSVRGMANLLSASDRSEAGWLDSSRNRGAERRRLSAAQIETHLIAH
jgi:phthiocerol/phenolphthiocerol synthesis type-I polyketide synthase E